MLTAAELDTFRRRLLALKERLRGDLSELEAEALRAVGAEASGGLSDVPIHPADLGTDNYDQEVSLGLLENEEKLLEEIDSALARIEQGTFGRCEECGREISRVRLEALPYTRYCVQCARKFERELKR